jgi:hypothetical protein
MDGIRKVAENIMDALKAKANDLRKRQGTTDLNFTSKKERL